MITNKTKKNISLSSRPTQNSISNNQTKVISNTIKLGSGSYGTIYLLSNKKTVMKEHTISKNNIEMSVCNRWNKEFKTQQKLSRLCNRILKQIGVSIATPYKFYYAYNKNSKRFLSNSKKGASSCLFTMERLPGRICNTNSSQFENKLSDIIKNTESIGKGDWVPPYMFMGSLKSEDGPVYLSMLKNSNCTDFVREELNYCSIRPLDESFRILQSMFLSFFVIICFGYIPRDIEYVFNGTEDNAVYISIIDFNEVRLIGERAESYGDGYDINEDIAHVYIDLCGLRAGTDRNPMAGYDLPTSQWKFLCSPMTAPGVFLELFLTLEDKLNILVPHISKREFNVVSVFKHIVSYVKTHIFHTKKLLPSSVGELREKRGDFDTRRYLGVPNEGTTKLPSSVGELFALREKRGDFDTRRYQGVFTIRPTQIYTVPITTPIENCSDVIKLGDFTHSEFNSYYSSLCYFYKGVPNEVLPGSIINEFFTSDNSKRQYLVACPSFLLMKTQIKGIEKVVLDSWMEFDIGFQQYIVLSLIDTLIKRGNFTEEHIVEMKTMDYINIINFINKKLVETTKDILVDSWNSWE